MGNPCTRNESTNCAREAWNSTDNEILRRIIDKIQKIYYKKWSIPIGNGCLIINNFC